MESAFDLDRIGGKMSVYLYAGGFKIVKKSGVGQALLHQQEVLSSKGCCWNYRITLCDTGCRILGFYCCMALSGGGAVRNEWVAMAVGLLSYAVGSEPEMTLRRNR